MTTNTIKDPYIRHILSEKTIDICWTDSREIDYSIENLSISDCAKLIRTLVEGIQLLDAGTIDKEEAK